MLPNDNNGEAPGWRRAGPFYSLDNLDNMNAEEEAEAGRDDPLLTGAGSACGSPKSLKEDIGRIRPMPLPPPTMSNGKRKSPPESERLRGRDGTKQAGAAVTDSPKSVGNGAAVSMGYGADQFASEIDDSYRSICESATAQFDPSDNRLIDEVKTTLQNAKDHRLRVPTGPELMRWIRAHNRDASAASKAFMKSQTWRRQKGVDYIRDWTPPEVLRKFYPGGFSGYDREGSPVWIIPFGRADVKGLLASISKQEFVDYTVRILETSLHHMKESSVKHGRPVTQHVFVFDMANFSFKNATHGPTLDIVQSLVSLYEDNYPETLKAAFVINSGKVFRMVFRIIKSYVNSNTLQKISVLGDDDWKQVLLEHIPADSLPQYWGGTKRLSNPQHSPSWIPSDGNCEKGEGDEDPEVEEDRVLMATGGICMGGEVPLYYRSSHKNGEIHGLNTVIKQEIEAGAHISVDMAIRHNTHLHWKFRTDGGDIRFRVERKRLPECAQLNDDEFGDKDHCTIYRSLSANSAAHDEEEEEEDSKPSNHDNKSPGHKGDSKPSKVPSKGSKSSSNHLPPEEGGSKPGDNKSAGSKLQGETAVQPERSPLQLNGNSPALRRVSASGGGGSSADNHHGGAAAKKRTKSTDRKEMNGQGQDIDANGFNSHDEESDKMLQFFMASMDKSDVETVLEEMTVKSSKETQTGYLLCSRGYEYKLLFDNRDSLLKGRRLYYSITTKNLESVDKFEMMSSDEEEEFDDMLDFVLEVLENEAQKSKAKGAKRAAASAANASPKAGSETFKAEPTVPTASSDCKSIAENNVEE